MDGKLKYYLILHSLVLIWGFTGILGDQISVSADYITFFRTAISFISLLILGFFVRNDKPIRLRQIRNLILTGAIVGLHWYTFFYAIKASTVSIGVVCISSMTLFTSIIEPIVFKRKFLVSELLLSIVIIVGIVIIFGFESQHAVGIISGLISAFLTALFTVINGKFITTISPLRITKYEMLGGCITLFIILLFSGKANPSTLFVPAADWVYLLILGLVCTTFAFMVSVWVMNYVTPFTISMSLNMEPIYTIIIALIIGAYLGTSKEHMSLGFYLGTAIIVGAIFTNAYLKKKAKQKSTSAEF